MSPEVLRPLRVAAAALTLGGILVVLNPDRLPSVAQVVLLTLAAAAVLRVPLVAVPVVWWTSPFDRKGDGEGDRGPDELEAIRTRLAGRRQRVPQGPALPPDVVRLLRGMIRRALEREGLDLETEVGLLEARTRVSPRAWGILTCPVLSRTSRFRTRRPDPSRVARAVQAVLDEVEELVVASPGGLPSGDRDTA
jgi:hypothetical protein